MDEVIQWNVYVGKLTGGESNYGITGTQREVILDIIQDWGDQLLSVNIFHPDEDNCDDNISFSRENLEELEWVSEYFDLDLVPLYLPPTDPDLVALEKYYEAMESSDFRPWVAKAKLAQEFQERHKDVA